MPYIYVPHDSGEEWLISDDQIIIPRQSIAGMTPQEIGLCVQVLANFQQRIPREYFYWHSSERLTDLLDYLATYIPEVPIEQSKAMRAAFARQRTILLEAVIDRDGEICRRCKTTETLSVDHVIPISRGGTNALDNLRLLCRSCNSKKSNVIVQG